MNNTGIVNGNVQENVPARPNNQHSSFPMSYNLCLTARFGELNCHFAMEGEKGDKLPLRSDHDLRTYSFKAPLMQDIEIHKAYFAVPRESILPLNWPKLETQPTIGDDIDAKQYGTSIEAFYEKAYNILKPLWDIAANGNETDFNRTTAMLRFLELGNLWFSRGSLMWQLGFHVDLTFYDASNLKTMKWDKMFDLAIEQLISGIGNGAISCNNSGFYVVNEGHPYLNNEYGIRAYTVREFLDMIMHEADWSIDYQDAETAGIANDWIINLTTDLFTSYAPIKGAQFAKKPIDIARALAYQIVCAHYFSNDAVDYIYSAEIYRENIYSLLDKFMNPSYSQSWYAFDDFTYNGIKCKADYLSAALFNRALFFYRGNFSVSWLGTNMYEAYVQYLLNMFWYQNSLRYRDYFTGARTRPLAVGNVNVNVDTLNQVVSVIDITRNIQMQRFLNSVNRIGRKFENYLEGIFGGGEVRYDYHNPQFLTHVQDTAYAVEVENTGDAQMQNPNSVTSVVKSNSGRFAFEFTPDRPTIVIGVEYFDIARNYVHQMDRQLFAVDRFDRFLPEMQYIGDQEVYGAELSMDNKADTFGYQLRYAEYKQRLNVAVGGFVENLPGYIFKANEDKFAHHYANGEVRLSPYYIRSHPFELDGFYVSLTGYSPASYFHFIVKNHNDMTATRNMAQTPTIL